MTLLPTDVVDVLEDTRDQTVGNTGMTSVVAIAYG